MQATIEGGALAKHDQSQTISAKHRPALFVAACLIAVSALAACGNSPAATTDPIPAVDVEKIDAGNYPTKPIDPASLGDATGPRVIEAERLADQIPLPTDIFPELNFSYGYDKVRIFTKPDAFTISRVLNLTPEEFSAATPRFITGFRSSARSDKNLRLSYEVENLVMLFSDDQAAKNAAIELGKDKPGSEPDKYLDTSIAKYPDARVFWSPEYSTLHSTAASGRFVIYTYVSDRLAQEISTPNLSSMAQKAERSIEVIGSRLSSFVPTPQDKLDSLPRDVDGILGMTVPAANNSAVYPIEPAAYRVPGALHVSNRINEDKKLFDELGVDLVAYNGGFLYRTRDSEAAAELVENRSTLGKLYTLTASPPGLPASKCYEYQGTSTSIVRFECSIASGRYAATISANQLADAHQRVSAQYLMMTTGK
ncbi:DUF7373 family lipoprotein [Nocardia salmonicida]|uniref:DUF7373 family lipoprotein n=1 Tax=Nocardia salmonicida TaxID=53431 RepID=UPI0033C24C6F